jgi:hypothetical protein
MLARPDNHSTLPRLVARCALVLFLICAPAALYAQSSCAPDSNGDFKPTSSVTCQLPESGELSFRDVVIPPDVDVGFARNPKNTPVTLRVSRNFTLNGRIVIGGSDGNGRFGGTAGPGGFD